jgi:hypothetical protein
MRDPDYLQSRLDQGKQQETWSPEQQIAHYAALIEGCDAKEAALHAEFAEMRGRPGLDSFRKRILDDAEQNANGRQEYVKKQDAARAEQVRRLKEQERLAEFQAKAQAAAPTLDDLDAEQRRQILLDLHVFVRIARRDDTRRPRLEVVFNLTSEAAAHLHEGELWATWNMQTPQGTYVTFVEEDWPPTPTDGSVGFAGVPENINEDDDDDGDGDGDGDDDGNENALDIRAASGYPADEDDPGAENPSTLPYNTPRHPEPSRGDCSACHGASGHSLRDRKRPADRRLPPPKMSLRFDSDWWPAPHR